MEDFGARGMNLFLNTLSTLVQKKEVYIDGKLFIFGVTKYNLGVIIFPNLDAAHGIDFEGDTFEEFVEKEIKIIKEHFPSKDIHSPISN